MKDVRTICFAAVVLFLCACSAPGHIHFRDGQTYDIDYEIEGDVWVEGGTTVNLPAGGSINYGDIVGYGNSRINILGGRIYNRLISQESSQVNMSSGSIFGLESFGSSYVNISGGLTEFLCSWHSSQVNISGGEISWNLWSSDSSQVNISGGSIAIGDYLYIRDSSYVNITGGSIDGWVKLYNESKIQIFGCDFAVDGQAAGYGELTSIFGGYPYDEPWRQLTGTLLSGELIDTGFCIGHDARIVLIPEPATALILGLGSVYIASRRRQC